MTFKSAYYDECGNCVGGTTGKSACIHPNNGYMADDNLWIRALIHTEEKGDIEAVWQKGGEDLTAGGHRVIWGYFHASPDDVNWGSRQNPDLFVKIWFDAGGRTDVNFFHVSVPDIEVYSDYPYDGTPDESGTTTMDARYIRQYYQNGQSNMEINYEDGMAAEGYWPENDPSGVSITDHLALDLALNLGIGVFINTEERGPIEAVWREGGHETTARGDQIIWGHFYASPSDVTWGSEQNPDLFVKIWLDASGRIDMNYFHVSVPEIEVYSYYLNYSDFLEYSERGTTIMSDRYIRHEFRQDW